MATTDDRKKPRETIQQEIEALYIAHREMVLQAAFRTIRNKEDAEDVLQTVFLRLIENPELHTGIRKNPAGYLYRAAIREALNLIDARERHGLTGEDIDSLQIAVPPPEFDGDVWRAQLAMAKLKPAAKEILSLYYDEGLDCFEIAKLQNKTAWAVFKELQRTRAELKKQLLIQEKRNETQKSNPQTSGRGIYPEASEA